jgi:hypothetical protein
VSPLLSHCVLADVIERWKKEWKAKIANAQGGEPNSAAGPNKVEKAAAGVDADDSWDDDDDSDDDDQGHDISLDNGAGIVPDHDNSPIIVDSDDDFINDHSDIYEDQGDGHEYESEVSPSHLIQGQRLCPGL